jgi:hypothetical protein
MNVRRLGWLGALFLASCGASAAPVATSQAPTASPPTAQASTSPRAGGITAIVGLTSRAEIEAAFPAWVSAAAEARPDPAFVARLGQVAPGAEIDVFLGTWCGDSRREVARFFVTLEQLPEPRPFGVRWIGVDRGKQAPGFTEGVDLRFVPTFVVRRGGVEVGRVIESAPEGIERALYELASGARTGVITGRTDL